MGTYIPEFKVLLRGTTCVCLYVCIKYVSEEMDAVSYSIGMLLVCVYISVNVSTCIRTEFALRSKFYHWCTPCRCQKCCGI